MMNWTKYKLKASKEACQETVWLCSHWPEMYVRAVTCGHIIVMT